MISKAISCAELAAEYGGQPDVFWVHPSTMPVLREYDKAAKARAKRWEAKRERICVMYVKRADNKRKRRRQKRERRNVNRRKP
jgi:hypothetical protein